MNWSVNLTREIGDYSQNLDLYPPTPPTNSAFVTGDADLGWGISAREEDLLPRRDYRHTHPVFPRQRPKFHPTTTKIQDPSSQAQPSLPPNPPVKSSIIHSMFYNPRPPQGVPPLVPQASANSPTLATTQSYKVTLVPRQLQKQRSIARFSSLHVRHLPSQLPSRSFLHGVERIKIGPLNLMTRRRRKKKKKKKKKMRLRHRRLIPRNLRFRNLYDHFPLQMRMRMITMEQESGSPLPT